MSLQDDLTFSNLAWHGDHTVKTGVKFKDVKLQDRDAGTSALYSFYVEPRRGVEADPFQVVFGAQADSDLSIVSTSKNKQYGIYIQDDWAVNDHLTLNLGVRYDYEETPTYTDFVTPQRFVDSLNGLDTNGCADPSDPALPVLLQRRLSRARSPARPTPRRWPTPASTSTTTSATASNRKNPKDQIQPRLGLSYDLFADQQHVIFAGAGRSYDRNVFGILQHETNKATLYVPTIQFWNASNRRLPAGHDGQSLLHRVGRQLPDARRGCSRSRRAPFGEMHLINNNLKAPYADQFSLGMRNRVGDWNTSAVGGAHPEQERPGREPRQFLR